MSNEVQRRWGIVALAAAMFFVTMVNSVFNGNKTSIYYFVWFMVGWYGFKGSLEQIKILMKFLIWLNLAVLLLVMMFFEEQTIGYVTRGEAKMTMVAGVLVMLVPKIFLYFYCDRQIIKTTASKGEDGVHSKSSLDSIAKPQNSYLDSMTEQGRKNFQMSKNIQTKQTESMEDAYKRVMPESDKNLKQVKEDSKQKIINEPLQDIEESIWASVAEEFDSETRRKGLYAKLFAEYAGDEIQIRANYYKTRVSEIKKEYGHIV